MFFFFKKKDLIMDCFLPESKEYIAKFSPITQATHFYPEWWKKLPSEYENDTDTFWPSQSMKRCSGILDYFHKSFAFPLWSDLALMNDDVGNFRWQFSDGITNADIITSKQWDSWLSPEKYITLRIISPWVIKMKEEISFSISQPLYNINNLDEYSVAQGVLDYKYQSSTSPILLINRQKAKRIIIPRNQVLYFMTPLTEKNIKIKRHIISDGEYARIRSYDTQTKFIGKHKDNIQQYKKFSKCPFNNMR